MPGIRVADRGAMAPVELRGSPGPARRPRSPSTGSGTARRRVRPDAVAATVEHGVESGTQERCRRICTFDTHRRTGPARPDRSPGVGSRRSGLAVEPLDEECSGPQRLRLPEGSKRATESRLEQYYGLPPWRRRRRATQRRRSPSPTSPCWTTPPKAGTLRSMTADQERKPPPPRPTPPSPTSPPPPPPDRMPDTRELPHQLPPPRPQQLPPPRVPEDVEPPGGAN